MAIEIKTIPVLHGEAAARFVEAQLMRHWKSVAPLTSPSK